MPRFKEHKAREPESSRLRRLRETLGFSQREMAEELHVAHGAIAQWETGDRTIPGPVLKLVELYEEELRPAALPATRDGRAPLRASWGSRSFVVSKTTASIIGSIMAGALRGIVHDRAWAGPIRATTQAAIARRIVKTVGELKGFAMKLGQMMCYLDFALPETSRRIYAKLETSSPPMAPAVASRVFREDFGKEPSDLFSKWSVRPFSVASIGQVHRATLAGGGRVAVKVQYPGIVKALQADLKSAELLDFLFSAFFRSQEAGAIVTELRERFLEECDYAQEARAQTWFRERFAGVPEIVIPKVHEPFSSGRVLTTEYVAGRSFEEFARTASQEERNRAGETIWRFVFESLLVHRAFNCDPHPGNYLFQDGKVVFLDFGCTKRFTEEFVTTWRAFMRATLEKDFPAARKLVIQMGMAPDPDNFDFRYHIEMIEATYEPWFHDGPFRFRPEYVTRTWEMMMVRNPNRYRMNLPRDWVFLNRIQWGTCAILARLGATANWRRKILALLY